jgi:hypothetical protein
MVADGVAQRREDLAVARRVHVEVGHGGDGDRAGQLTGRVAAHAVRDHEQGGTGVPGVLVALTDEADVGARCVAEMKGHAGLLLDLQRGAADPQRCAHGQHGGRRDAGSVDPGAVGGAEVLDHP